MDMASAITDDCIGCGNCEPACPCGAISKAGEVYVVDPHVCTDCVAAGGCVGVEICPTEAIVAATTAMTAVTAVAI
jgi:ferredoxin